MEEVLLSPSGVWCCGERGEGRGVRKNIEKNMPFFLSKG